MLNPDAGQTSADVKRAARKRPRVGPSAAAIEIINEPRSDWVLPWEAPFYCFSGGYIRSAREWAGALQAEVQKIINSDVWADALQADTRKILKAEGITETEYRSGLVGTWSFNRKTKAPGAWIIAKGIRTDIKPGFVSVIPIMPGDDDRHDRPRIDLNRWLLIGGHSKEILSDPEWDEGPCFFEAFLDQKLSAQWHRRLLEQLFRLWERSFTRAIESGAAHIMARTHSILAPFERITWNQWQYFRLDEELPPPKDPKWGEPRSSSKVLPWTATGPGGEKLYEIHIAPGSSDPNRENNPEEKCLQWLTELILDRPDRPPKPRDLLAREGVSKFPGLTLNGFLRSFARAQALTGNQKWSRPGRFPKSPQKSPQHI
jgi:hypothetical protein